MTFVARFTTQCARCGDDLTEGELAHYDRRLNVAVHSRCPNVVPDVSTTIVDACPVCHTVHKGECL